ncbi:MAG: hypothetical protein M3Y51_06315 [Actinomycetota bacterium]|nr:hypothetical protein [Actinomycetota bacterium]
MLDETDEAERSDRRNDDGDRDESAIGAVDLTSDGSVGSANSSTPVGVLVALVVVLALGGGAVVVNRRRAVDPE